jgi:hypothetical protein
MLGGLCDTLASFLFDVAWSRAPATKSASEQSRYEDFDPFNASLDDQYEAVEIAGSTFLPSRILHALDPIQYETSRVDWEAEQAVPSRDEGAAA